jgi:thioredoxin reductase (NADPH)
VSRRRVLIAGGLTLFAVVALFLAVHRTYSPGQVMSGHQPFKTDCSSCHEPWHGVQIASTGCIDCHGNIPNNPHFPAAVSDKDSGLIAGKQLVSFKDKLVCMTCHVEHLGVAPNFAKVSGQSCSECHQHDAIADVGAHKKKPMLLKGSAMHIFAGETDPSGPKMFSHKGHLQDAIDKLAKIKERAQKMRPGKNKDKAEADVAALGAMLDSSGQNFTCVGCHVVKAALPGAPEKMEIAVAGCKTSGCHSGWRDDALKLGTDAPDYAAQQNASSPEPETIAYLEPAKFLHVESEFAHSPGHLEAKCIECHLDIEKSERPGDTAVKHVSNCFGCHAHQSAAAPGSVASVTQPAQILGVSDVMAADEGSADERKVTACAKCHLFHTYYHGASKVRDFTSKAPISRPHPAPAIRLASFAPRLTRSGGSITGMLIKPVTLTLWWIPFVAIAVMGGFGYLYMKFLPQEIGVQRTHGQVAAQRSAEVPMIDDTYNSNVPGLYVVGETAGTASINLAMRSGRQAVQFIANLLKATKPAGAPDLYDVVVVGSGPAGISAGATAKSQQLRYVGLEKTTAASTIRDYPRGKFVQATPLNMTEYGGLLMEGDYNKETLVKKWEEMLASLKLDINERDEVIAVEKADHGFSIKTASGKLYKARYVVLAIGVRGTPRKLGVPGEAPDRVFNNLVEPEEFQNKNIIVVGGGNAGAEVAQALSNPALHNKVGYSIRDLVLGPPVTPENAEKIAALQAQGLLTLYPSSEVKELKPGKIILAPRARKAGGPELTGAPGAIVLNAPTEMDNDVVFAMLGAELPTRFMKATGIRMVKKGK